MWRKVFSFVGCVDFCPMSKTVGCKMESIVIVNRHFNSKLLQKWVSHPTISVKSHQSRLGSAKIGVKFKYISEVLKYWII